MAFEVPIEADSPNNDAGFISSLIKAPISGLMWILGMKENNQRADETQPLSTAETSDASAPEIICNFSEWHKTKGILSDRPGAVSSDTSEASDHETSACCSKEERTDNDCFDLSAIHPSSSRNNITWSDQSGSSLVFYCDESGRDLHEPPQLSSECAFPIKSAIKSSKSAIVANRPSAVSHENCATFKSSGMNGSFSAQSSGGFLPNSALGTVSPQWGWYTTGSTTPPSPELFAHSGRKSSSTQDAHASQVNSSSLGPSVGLSSAAFVNMDRRRAGLPLHSHQDTHPRPAFTKNTKGILNNSRGWPSVPL